MFPLVSGAQSPDCPCCGDPPLAMIGTHQALCGNDDCRALMWDVTKTPAQNMASASTVDLDRAEMAETKEFVDKIEDYVGFRDQEPPPSKEPGV